MTAKSRTKAASQGHDVKAAPATRKPKSSTGATQSPKPMSHAGTARAARVGDAVQVNINGQLIEATLGPDVDLDQEVVLVGGKRLTNEGARKMAEEITAQRIGRPSLSGGAGNSPQVAFRLPPELRAKAERLAEAEGKSLSALAREAFMDRLSRSA